MVLRPPYILPFKKYTMSLCLSVLNHVHVHVNVHAHVQLKVQVQVQGQVQVQVHVHVHVYAHVHVHVHVPICEIMCIDLKWEMDLGLQRHHWTDLLLNVYRF